MEKLKALLESKPTTFASFEILLDGNDLFEVKPTINELFRVKRDGVITIECVYIPRLRCEKIEYERTERTRRLFEYFLSLHEHDIPHTQYERCPICLGVAASKSGNIDFFPISITVELFSRGFARAQYKSFSLNFKYIKEKDGPLISYGSRTIESEPFFVERLVEALRWLTSL
jgi:hypothetical protein